MVDYHVPSNLTGPFLSSSLHLRDASGDESLFPASTLSPCSDYDSSSDVTSLLLTVRSTSPTNLLDESGFGLSVSHTGTCTRESAGLEKWTKHSTLPNSPGTSSRILGRVSPWPQNFFLEQTSTTFTPIPLDSVHLQRSRTPSPGISKMLLSLSDHTLERPCTPNASTLYKNTKTYCNPSELGQQTYDECMFFTNWANSFLGQSQDRFLITDLARDLGDGLTLLTLVEMLVGEYPPQIHIKPALDVQKMENVQTCLNFLEHYDVSINGIAAEDIVKGNLKVVLALCHSLYRHFASSAGAYTSFKVLLSLSVQKLLLYSLTSFLTYTENPPVYHLAEKGEVELFHWVSSVTMKQISDYQSFEDGTVLCLLLNKMVEGAVPDLVLEFGSPAEKVSFVLKLSSEHLGIVTPVQTDDIINQRNRENFLEYLKSLYLVHSGKTKEIHTPDALEQSTLRRDIKKLQLREQRLRDRHGSQLTYLGEASQDKSRIAQERLQLSLADLSRVVSDIESLDSKRQEVAELTQVYPVSADTVVHNETLGSTKRHLDELEKELRLLQLEGCAENHGYKSHWTDTPWQLSLQDSSSSRPREESLIGKPANPRQELRYVYRNTCPTNGTSGRKSPELVGSRNLAPTSRCSPFHSDRDDGKLPFGGCYLSEPHGGFTDVTKQGFERNSFGESLVFKEYQVEPSSLNEKKAFTPHKSSGAMIIPVNDTLQTSFFGQTRTSTPHSFSQSVVGLNPRIVDDHRLFPKSFMETHSISKLFDVDFCDLDAKMSRDQESRALKRMMQAGNRSKLDRIGVDGQFSAIRGTENVYDKIGKPVPTPTAKQQLNTVRRTPRYGSGPELAANGAVSLNGGLTRDFSFFIDKTDDRGRLSTRNSRLRGELVAVQPANINQSKVNGEVAKPLLSSSTMRDHKERLTTPLSFGPSSKPDDTHKRTREPPLETSSQDSSEPARSLNRSLSNEKRHRKQVLDKKSGRKAQPSSTKAHVHALTALIRMSAKNAGGSCSEEDN